MLLGTVDSNLFRTVYNIQKDTISEFTGGWFLSLNSLDKICCLNSQQVPLLTGTFKSLRCVIFSVNLLKGWEKPDLNSCFSLKFGSHFDAGNYCPDAFVSHVPMRLLTQTRNRVSITCWVQYKLESGKDKFNQRGIGNLPLCC